MTTLAEGSQCKLAATIVSNKAHPADYTLRADDCETGEALVPGKVSTPAWTGTGRDAMTQTGDRFWDCTKHHVVSENVTESVLLC